MSRIGKFARWRENVSGLQSATSHPPFITSVRLQRG